MRYRILVCAFLLLLINTAVAQENMVIDADQITYDRQNNLLEAQGNVLATSESLKISADMITYETESKYILSPSNFNLERQDISFEGSGLRYNTVSQEGKVDYIHLNFGGFHLKGEKVEIFSDKLELKNAILTSCDLTKPHYRVSAATISIYPKTGWIVCSWGYLWIGDVPTVPVPTYIYDVYAKDKKRKNMPPFPDVGSNQQYGAYITQRMAWYLNQHLHGLVAVTYAEKKGWGGGLEGNYYLNQDNEGDIRFYTNSVDKSYGGITHLYSFGDKILNQLPEIAGLSLLPTGRKFELETILSYREEINYERVSQLPNITIRSKQMELWNKNLKIDLSAAWGFITEESTAKGLNRNEYLSNLNYDIYLQNGFIFTPGLAFNHKYYSDNSKWLRGMQLLKLVKSTEKIDIGIEHLHYYYIDGTSPFNFENYRFVPSDEIDLSLFFKFANSKLGMNVEYYVPSFVPKDIDYTFYAAIHCYAIIFKYRSIRNEFTFGADLLAGSK